MTEYRELLDLEQHGCVETDENGAERYFDFVTACHNISIGKKVTNRGCISDCFYLWKGLLVGIDGKTRSFPINAFVLGWELFNEKEEG